MKKQRGGEMSFLSYVVLVIVGSVLYFIGNSIHVLMQ